MIGLDLLRNGVTPEHVRRYLGTLDEWVGLTVGEIKARLGAKGYDVEGLTLLDLGRLMREGTLEPTRVPEPSPLEEVPPSHDPGVRTERWTCPQGHSWTAYEPYRWRVTFSPAMQSDPLCPYCVIEFANKAFPASRVEP
jgi:hypothetical protein